MSGKIARAIDRFVSPISRVSTWVAMAVVMGIMCFITVNVIMRYGFNFPIRGIGEVVEVMMVLLIFFALAYAAARGGNIAVTLVISRLPQRARVVFGIITCFLSVGVVGLISWRSIRGGIRMMLYWGEETAVWGIPIFPFRFALAFGITLLCLKLIADFVRSLSREVKD